MKIRMPVKAQRPILSIGMIVKNEEKNLEKCLEGLKPLLDAVPSELIIADTGSTDRTWEIAERYADQLFHFEWIDDFAAARNSTLDRSTGTWYMFVDADEWFQDCDDLISFFSDRQENAKYNCATFIVRNYRDYEKKDYMDFFAARIVRVTKSTRFHSKVHEYLERFAPCKNLYSIADHFGYVGNNDASTGKIGRNLPILLKMLEDGVEEEKLAHTYFQVGREYGSVGDWENAALYARKGIGALTPQKRNTGMEASLYHDLIMSRAYAGQWDELIEASEDYLKKRKIIFSVEIDIRYFLSDAWRVRGDFDKARQEREEYFRLSSLLGTGKLDESDRSITVLVCQQLIYRNTALFLQADAIKDEDTKEALHLLDQIQGWTGIEPKDYARLECELVVNAKAWGRYARGYPLAKESTSYFHFYKLFLDSMVEQFPEARQEVAESFIELGYAQDSYVLSVLMRAQASQARSLLEEALPKLEPDLSASKLLYYAMKEQIDIAPFIDRIDSDNLGEWTNSFGTEEDAGQVISDYYAGKGPEQSLRSIRWKCALMEHILLSADPENELHRRNFASYCEAVIAYVTRLYGTEMPDAEVFGILPHAHRFAYHMRDALAQIDQGETIEAMHSLLAAGKAYPYLLRFVQQMIQEHKQAPKIQGRQMEGEREEAELLTKEIKRSIREFIMEGDQENASQLLKRYASLRPDDEEIAALYQEMEQPVLQS